MVVLVLVSLSLTRAKAEVRSLKKINAYLQVKCNAASIKTLCNNQLRRETYLNHPFLRLP